MSEQQFTRITVSSRSYYSEQETAEYSRLELQVLRHLSESGVIPGMQVVGEEARYSDEDLILLRRARRLHQDLGVNLEGIEIILRLLVRLDALQRELDNARRKP
jgi:DNA-binding transcriptional MerR regulator